MAAPARTIDSFFLKSIAPPASTSTSTSTKTNKRTRDSSITSDEPATTKKPRATPKQKLKNSTVPVEPNAKKCISKWNLLPPYDTRITEERWGEYFEERLTLEKTNTEGSDEYKRVKSEELMQNTARLLGDDRDEVSKAILGSCMESPERDQLAESIRGSLYYMDLWGNEEDGGGEDEDGGRRSFSPMTVSCTTRLYSPFGLGTSVDFKYHYYVHWRRATERFSALVMCSREVGDCKKAGPYECSAEMGGRGAIGPPVGFSVRFFNWPGKKCTGPTAANMVEIEACLFESRGWLCPRLMFNLLCAAGTATLYQEENTSHVWSAQAKFKLYDGEKEEVSSEEK